MYGVVEVSGHQYRVQVGDIIDVEKLSLEEGSSILLDQVLFLSGKSPKIGLPTVPNAVVKSSSNTPRTQSKNNYF